MKHCPNADCPHRRAVGSPAEFVDDARTSCSDCGAALAEGIAERQDEKRRPLPRALSWRLVITLTAPLVAVLASFVPVPGLDVASAALAAPFFPDVAPISVVHLGLWPVLQAAVLVELAAAVVPGWRPLRVTVEGRRRLWRVTLLAALVLAIWDAVSVARAMDRLVYAVGPYSWLVVSSLVAGVFALLALAALVSARGLGPGLAVVGLAGASPDLRAGLFLIRNERALTLQELVYFLGPIVATVVATLWMLRAHRRIARTVVVEEEGSPQEAAEPYRGRRPPEPGQLPLVRVPASGLVPLWILPAIGAVLERVAFATGSFGVHTRYEKATTPLVTLLFVLAAGTVLSLIWAAPLPLSRVWARATDRTWEAIDERRARALQRPTFKATFAYLALLALLASTGGVRIWLLLLAAATVAVVYDAAHEWRARRAHADELISVGEEHRVELADAATLALERAGIPAHVRGIHLRTLLRVLGPFAPMEIMVPQQAAADAKKVLQKVL